MLLRVGLKAKRSHFDSLASAFGKISNEAIHRVAEHMASGDSMTFHTEEEQQVIELMKQVNAVSTSIQGSSASKLSQRSELKALTSLFESV